MWQENQMWRQPGQENHLLVKLGKMPDAGGAGPCRSRGRCPKFAWGHWVSAPSSRSLHLRVPLCLMLARGNAKLLLTLSKLISGLNSLLGAGNRRAGPSCQFQISECPAKLTANDPESNTLCPARPHAATGHQNVRIYPKSALSGCSSSGFWWFAVCLGSLSAHT